MGVLGENRAVRYTMDSRVFPPILSYGWEWPVAMLSRKSSMLGWAVSSLPRKGLTAARDARFLWMLTSWKMLAASIGSVWRPLTVAGVTIAARRRQERAFLESLLVKNVGAKGEGKMTDWRKDLLEESALAKNPEKINRTGKNRRTLCRAGCGRRIWGDLCRKCKRKMVRKSL